jgi:tetratricopeptide (TPR) repeat protein
MCGVAIGLAQVAEFAMQRSKQAARSSNSLVAVCALTFLLLGLTSFSWTGVWADDLSLWSYGVDSSPKNFTANLNLGNALRSKGYRKEGCVQLKTALSLVDAQKHPGTASKIFYNLGNCARENEQWTLATQRYKESSRLSGGQFLPAHFNLVTTYENSGQMQAALVESEHLIAEAAELARSWHLHGAILAKLGRYSEAIKAFDRALSIDPKSEDSARFRLRAQELQEASTDTPGAL